MDLGLGLEVCLRAMLSLGVLAVEALVLTVLFGAVSGRAPRSRALAGSVVLVTFLVAALGPSIEGLSSAVGLSPFHTLVEADPFRRVPPVGDALVLVLPSLLFLVVAVARFQRRDLRLP